MLGLFGGLIHRAQRRMKTVRSLLGRLLVCGFIAIFSLGFFALDAWPVPIPLHHAEGRIISRTPIYSKGKLTGFRFCIDSPRLTFTYANPDPRVESMSLRWPGRRRCLGCVPD